MDIHSTDSVEDLHGDGSAQFGGSLKTRSGRGGRHGGVVLRTCTAETASNKDTLKDYGCKRLHKAAQQGRVDLIERMLAGDGARFADARDDSGRTALHWAARKARRAVVRVLIAAEADPNATDREGITPLHLAAITGIIPADLNCGVNDSCSSQQGVLSADGSPLGQHFPNAHRPQFDDAVSNPTATSSRRDGPTTTAYSLNTPPLPGEICSREEISTYCVNDSSMHASLPWTRGDGGQTLAASRDGPPRRINSSSASSSVVSRQQSPVRLRALRSSLFQSLDPIDTGPLAAMIISPGRLGRLSPARQSRQQRGEGLGLEGGSTAPRRVVANSWLTDERITPTKSAEETPAVMENVHSIPALPSGSESFDDSPLLVRRDKGGSRVGVSARRPGACVLELLALAGAELNAIDTHQRTALHWAAWKGQADCTACLLRCGADVSLTDNDGRTALHLAAISGQPMVVRELLRETRSGTCDEQLDPAGRTALHLASYWGQAAVVTELLRAGADLEARDDDGSSPLLLAAWKGHTATLEVLLFRRADVDAQNNAGSSALHLAALSASLPAVSVLLCSGNADPSAHDNASATPLHLAASAGSVDVCRTLLQRGAPLNVLDGEGATPLRLAAAAGHAKVVVELLSGGADAEARRNSRSGNALHFAAESGDADTVDAVVRFGCRNLNAPDAQGRTALHLAAARGHLSVVSSLLSHGASSRLADMSGRTALHHAAEGGFERVAKLLGRRKSALLRRDASGATALLVAVKSGHARTVSTLLRLGSDAAVPDAAGRCPLAHAAHAGCLEVVDFLLQAGVAVNARDSDGRSALHYAVAGRHTQVTERLIAVGASTQGADTEGRTLLHWAAWHGCEATVNALLAEPCVDVNAADIKGRTAMHLAAHAGQVNVMQRLAAAGAKRRVKDIVGRRPIDYCTAGDWKTRVRLASVLNNPTQAVVHFFTACTSLQG